MSKLDLFDECKFGLTFEINQLTEIHQQNKENTLAKQAEQIL